jgi:hypothetical protein
MKYSLKVSEHAPAFVDLKYHSRSGASRTLAAKPLLEEGFCQQENLPGVFPGQADRLTRRAGNRHAISLCFKQNLSRIQALYFVASENRWQRASWSSR